MAYVILTEGLTYQHRSGGEYLCKRTYSTFNKFNGKLEEAEAQLERIGDGYTLTAHGTRIEDNGKIHWDYSTGGHWQK